LQLVLDHESSPRIGRAVTYCAGNTFQRGEFMHVGAKRELERIELDRFPALEVTIAIAKATDESSVAQFFDLEQRCGHGIQCAGQLHVDVYLALRSHIRSSMSA